MITPFRAATLIAEDYADNPVTTGPVERLSIKGVQAAIFTCDGETILLIRGTDEASDWFRYNFETFVAHCTDFGDTMKWHRGFLHYSQICYAFGKGKGVTLVIGHSLGAAAAQIVAPSLNVKAMAFASPRPLFGETQPLNGKNVINYCRADDLVTMLPPYLFGFCHVGAVKWLLPEVLHAGEDHRIAHYLELLTEDQA